MTLQTREMLLDVIEAKDRRIAELEARLAVNAEPQTARKPCRHEAIIGLDSKWHCQRCGDAIEITAAFPRSQADSASIREAHEAFDRKLRNNVIEECAEVAEKYWAREVASQIRALTRPACTPTDNKEVGQL